jgi:peptide subunit release factor 1 (eRF1)
LSSSIFDGGIVAISPPSPITRFNYLCDSRFHTELIESLYEEETEFHGIVILLGEEASFYRVGHRLIPKFLSKIKSRLPKKHKKGGQSQNRIQRLRTETIHNYITFIEEAVSAHFIENGLTTIKSLIVSGPSLKKEQLTLRLKLDCPISLYTEQNVYALLEKYGQEIISKNKNQEEIVKEIKEYFRVADERLVFGDDIYRAYNEGTLEKIWCRKECKEDFTLSNKTKIIVLDHYFLKDYGDKIGLLWL